MNAPVDLTEDKRGVSRAEAETHLRAGDERARDLAGIRRMLRALEFRVGAVGAVLAVLGLGTAAAVSWSKETPAPIFIRQGDNGELARAARPLEAAATFTDATVRQHLRAYVDYCETYRWQVFNEATARCQLFMAPAVQKDYARIFEPGSGANPTRILGRDGTANVADRITYEPMMRGRDGTQVWMVRFVKVVAQPGKAPECIPWAARLTFQWRPDLKMKDADRDINLGGMQIIDRNSVQDELRAPGCGG